MKRNKLLIFILAMILCIGVFTGTVFAEDETASPTATTSTKSTVLAAPTYVTALNYQEYMSFESNSASATHTHKYVFYSFDAPSSGKNSVSEDGLITGTCSYCGKMLSVSVPYGMTYQVTARKDATEASDGYIRYDYDANNSTLKLTDEQKENALLTFTITLPAKTKCTSLTGHKWDAGKVTTEATCASKGVMTYTCENCGATKTELIDRTNHYKQNQWVFLSWVVKPTCKDPIGSALYYCEQCDKNVQFVRGGTDAELSGAHTWDKGEVITSLTDEEDGETLYTCSLCGETKTETLHNWVALERKDATCTEDGYIQYVCANCEEQGEKEILPATGHNWLTLEDGTKYCSLCNKDEEGKPLFIAANYEVSKTEQDYSSAGALGDFAGVIGEDERPVYLADIKMVSLEDGEEVSEFSEHGSSSFFDISLTNLEIDSSTPMEEIHVYQQHEDGEPNEIPECDKIIEEGVLRVFTRDFSVFLVTANHTWETLEDGTKYCSVCNIDEERKPLYIAADYVVSQTEQDYTSEEALGDFANIIGENEEPLYYAEIKMHSVEDDEEVSEFSEHGNCPSFDISLADLGVDSSTPIEDIHVYHQHEDGEPYEIPDCDKMIVGDCLRVFVRNFSPFVLAIEEPTALVTTGASGNFFFTTSQRTDITITGIDWQETDAGINTDIQTVSVVLYNKDKKPIKADGSIAETADAAKQDLNKGNNFSCIWSGLTSGEIYYLQLPEGFSVSGQEQQQEKYPIKTGTDVQLNEDVFTISYTVNWDDYDDYYSLRPTKEVIISATTDKGKTWVEVVRPKGEDSGSWIVPVSVRTDTGTSTNPNYEWKTATYRVTQTISESSRSKDAQCYTVTYSLNGGAATSSYSANITAEAAVSITNKLKEKDWSLSKTWRNSTRLVVTMPYSITCELLYSKDAVNWQYVRDSRNNNEPMEFMVKASDGWSATIQHLPSAYYYRFIETKMQLGGTTYSMTPTNGTLTPRADGTISSTPTAGYIYRYLYRSLNSNTQNKTIITNTYNPSAVPYTGDSSNLLLWSVVAAATVLTLTTGTVIYVRKSRRKNSGSAD